jgi:hypothetical protein
MAVRRDGARGMSSYEPGVAYRLHIQIGAVFTAARYETAHGSGALRLSPYADQLPSARFLASDGVQVESLAETLRGIVVFATRELREVPASVGVRYPASWESSQLLKLWEALVLAGIPDADTQPIADPRTPLSTPLSPADYDRLPTGVTTAFMPPPPPMEAASRLRRGWLVGAAFLTVIAGVTTGVFTAGTPLLARTPGGATTPTGSPPAATQITPSPASATTAEPSTGPGVNLPTSDPLPVQQFVVPRGRNPDTELNVANVAGVVGPRTLSTADGRNSWPMLSADRRTIIYINYAAGSLRAMAADGSGDRSLIKPQQRNCGEITRASWSPADESIMVVECRAEDRPDRLLVIKLDGTVIRELRTDARRVEDPTISPDGRTVAYWADDNTDGPNGGSIYTLAMDGSSEPVRLTDRRAGSDADPAWSPDGSMIAFRRRGPNDNFDVYVMRSDGSDVRPVATGPAVEEKPAWSPDGRELMIISNRDASGEPGESYDVYVLEVDGGTPRPLGLTANVVLTPVWSYR